ncbi:DUF3089 domain-containing protein [Erythrobacter litoralis]|uniref:DUF3089 domain-containing protein n=1 Tax=Erythrobacter litoralis TaxID=39960 RepID=UPI002434DB06|nr:DUF3089 domain-containing protein [Erythrobacter litoralis]MDG6078860.1 DUF3089 domain-containing protein [Erythrobacter litoralis]
MKHTRIGIVFALTLGTLASPSAAQPVDPSQSPSGELYADADKWLCLPGREDICDQDLTTTIVAADGSMTREAFAPPADAPVDCFYIYPTVSLDQGANADWNAGAEETRVVQQQLARFADVCRIYAPKYRQITLRGTTGQIPRAEIVPAFRTAYGDVVDAWNHYLANYNEGRGVILIGHSQGSRMLTQLTKTEIDGKPVQDRIVAAYLNGTSVLVPEGEVVGGDFQSMPLCTDTNEIGCIVAYRSFRDTLGPVNDYAATSRPGMAIACVNPAAPTGGEAPLHSYLTTAALMGGPVPEWTTDGRTVDTPFASVPGLLTGECVSNESGQYLTIRIKADPDDVRTDDITGDIYTDGEINPDMGLHLIDMNLVMGNLLDLARSQSAAWLEAASSRQPGR